MDKKILLSTHDQAWEQAKEKLPVVEVSDLINLGVLYLNREITLEEIFDKYGSEYKEAIQAYASSFGHNFIRNTIEHYKNKANESNCIDTEEVTDQILAASVSAMELVKKFCKKELSHTEFMKRLGDSGVKETAVAMLKVNDIDIEELKKSIVDMSNSIQTASSATIAYVAFTEAYKILMEALDDASVQHEHMLMVEKECSKAIEMIKVYRKRMQDSIDRYFSKHLNVFSESIEKMDKAILENDSNGYLESNAEIQKVLNYNLQFSNQKEFDELMGSDDSFKL